MKLETRGRITVFVLSFAIWLALTAGAGLQEIIAGVIVAVIVTLIAGRFVFAQTPPSKKSIVRRETGSWRWAAFMFGYMTALAWVGALVVYQGGRLLGFT